MPTESQAGVRARISDRHHTWRLSLCFFGTLLLAHALCPSMGRAQQVPPSATAITSSGLGTQVQLNGVTGAHDITDGTTRGANLFHSFGQFTIAEGGVANFVGSPGVSNVLGRVTGGEVSKIWGRIQTTGFDAGFPNLFLINPTGWVFGPTASIDVGGSFHVSTANSIRLSDGVQFDLSVTEDLLTSAPPAAFGFLGPAAPIIVEGAVLTVAETKTLSLVGGDVSITGATLSAPSGRIEVVAAASAGEVTIPDLDVSSFSSLGQIAISSDSVMGTPSLLDATAIPILDPNPVGGGAGGEVIIRGGQLIVSGSTLQTGGFGDLNGVTPKIDVAVRDSITLESSLLDASGRQTFDADFNATGGGAGGAVVIRGGSLFASGSTLLAVTYGSSNGATPGIDIALTADLQMQTFSGMTTATLGGGRAGDVEITARSVMLADNSNITTSTLGSGSGGDVNISTSSNGSIVLSGFSGIGTVTAGDGAGGKIVLASPSMALEGGAFFISQSLGAAAGGDLVVEAGDLTLTAGAFLRSETSGAAGGDIFVTATGAAMIAGSDSGIFSGGSGLVEGAPAGNISLSARQLTLTGGARIQNGTISDRAGSILVTATDSIVISDYGKILSQAFVDQVGDVTVFAPSASLVMDTGLIQTSTIQQGNAGNITVDVASLSLTNGAQIVTSSAESATGLGGKLTISAANSVSISGSSPGDPVSVLSGNDRSSGLFSTASQSLDAAAQGGGQIEVLTAALTMSDGAKISAFTPGAGPAGSIALNVNTLSVGGGSQVVSSTTSVGSGGTVNVTTGGLASLSGADSGLFSTTTGSGNAGQITVTAASLAIADGAAISVATEADGAAGNIALNVSNLTLTGGARISSSTAVSGPGGTVEVTAGGPVSLSGAASGLFSTTAGSGNAGQITVTAGSLAIADGSAVSVATTSTGNAGTIAVTAGQITVSGANSTVSSTTSGAGEGGSITLTGTHVNILAGGSVTAEASSTGNAGTVTITATGANTLTISGAGSTVSTSTLGDGNGGDVILTSAGDVNILDGGSVTADSLGGAGRTGTITITAGDSIIMNNGTISTRAVTSDGGDIKLTAPNVVQLEGSQITTSVESGVGIGGNITIDPQFVIVNNSSIIANAFGGPGGNITIIANNFLSSANSVIEASSALSTPGVINIFSPENNVENSISQLPAAFIDASALLRGLCTARRTGAASSFVVAGRGGVPGDADGYLPSFGTDVAAAVADTGGTANAAAGRTSEPPLAVALLLANDLDCAR